MAENSITQAIQLIAIGGSAGSLDVILKLIPALNPRLPAAIIIITHRKASSEEILVDLLNAKSTWPVREAEEKDTITPHTIYIAPTDYHLLIEQDHSFSLDVSEKVNYSRPSIDITFESAAEVYGPAALGVLLSGANADGVEGLRHIKARGGLCLVQDPDTADVDYMPRQAITQVKVDKVLPADQLAGYINKLFEI
jgi:two-component system chemotaxis response regulator CheB